MTNEMIAVLKAKDWSQLEYTTVEMVCICEELIDALDDDEQGNAIAIQLIKALEFFERFHRQVLLALDTRLDTRDPPPCEDQ